MVPTLHSSMLYSAVEMQRFALSPLRMLAKFNKDIHANDLNPLAHTKWGRSMRASFELFERLTRHYSKPSFDIKHSYIGDKKIEVEEVVVEDKPFCQLRHFKKQSLLTKKQQKLLIVAPMSGHFSTLLRGTVKGLLPHLDVYITDWKNASDIPLSEGKFGFEDFVDYVIDFIHDIGKNIHVMAVCQPSVPVLTAVSIMSLNEDPYTPNSMTLMGGPIDARHNPTDVNDYAAEKTIHWFEKNVITTVPINYKGYMRQVYPGFLQLYGFMAMNLHRHIDEHFKFFNHLVEGDGESAVAHKKFYNEYLSVMDLPATFYLETVSHVFKDFLLPRGKLYHRGQHVKPSAIKKTALLTIEGEKDDISGRNQTKAAHKLCKNIPENKKKHHLQMDVGHYGIFNGKRYQKFIVPIIKDFIETNAVDNVKQKKTKAKKQKTKVS